MISITFLTNRLICSLSDLFLMWRCFAFVMEWKLFIQEIRIACDPYVIAERDQAPVYNVPVSTVCPYSR